MASVACIDETYPILLNSARARDLKFNVIFSSGGRARPAKGLGLRSGPSLVVEVLSPVTRRRDHEYKRDFYRCWCNEYWIVDPEENRGPFCAWKYASPDMERAMPHHNRRSSDANNEAHERNLNMNRAEEQREASAVAVARLNDLGIVVDDVESSEIVANLLEAVETFERAVEAAGGDLMVDTPPSQLPDDPRFMLPRRLDDETVSAYTNRVRLAARQLRQPLK
jgi:hypothetical protein